MPHRTLRSTAVAALLAGCFGCGQPKHVEVTNFDVGVVTAAAMQQLDTNQDTKLDSKELKQAPGLQRSRKEIDSNRDGVISEDELRLRLQSYIDQRIAILPYPIHVTWRDRRW